MVAITTAGNQPSCDKLVEMRSAGKTIATEEFSRKKLSKEFVGFLEKQSGCS